MAPPSIAAVQEEDGEGEEGEESGSGPGAAIVEPSEPSQEGAQDASAAEGEEETGNGELSEEEQEIVDDLKQRDAEVRRHEQAHKAVGGQYAGAISYTYQSGPDGNRYAVGGEVPIDASPIPGDPEATIRKLQQVRSAALAPAEPSGADRAVAAQATQGIQQARAEQAQESAEELEALFEGGEEATDDTEIASPETGPAEAAETERSAESGPISSVLDGAGTDNSGENGPELSGRSIGENASESGPFAVRPEDEQDSKLLGERTDRRSPFDFNPSAGRQTLDIVI
ncbi:hypothetical protein NUH88_01075 [Nisaea acidiphila]|uniref:SprA-related family protein n=1 Tax=Nisaea acidiphila TaxID=1862145 RepID=A0A9J7AVH2_9PROT|nr:putative metalloprotease CJM1_0395 family protein [Nisaea acidiphila]UUX50292.1 hypothetical protein NUH88_01075 [Nisaea acidiphila]